MFLFSIFFACNALQKNHENFDFTVPDTFSGWVFIEYEVESATPLQKVDGREQLIIPADGFLQIPNPFQSAHLDYTYKTVSGKEIPQLRLEKLSPDEELKTIREEPFVCCLTTHMSGVENGQERRFYRFYIGPGPAGTPPEPREVLPFAK